MFNLSKLHNYALNENKGGGSIPFFGFVCPTREVVHTAKHIYCLSWRVYVRCLSPPHLRGSGEITLSGAGFPLYWANPRAKSFTDAVLMVSDPLRVVKCLEIS